MDPKVTNMSDRCAIVTQCLLEVSHHSAEAASVLRCGHTVVVNSLVSFMLSLLVT